MRYSIRVRMSDGHANGEVHLDLCCRRQLIGVALDSPEDGGHNQRAEQM